MVLLLGSPLIVACELLFPLWLSAAQSDNGWGYSRGLFLSLQWIWRKEWSWALGWRTSGTPELLLNIPLAIVSQRTFPSQRFLLNSLKKKKKQHWKKTRSLEWSATIHKEIIPLSLKCSSVNPRGFWGDWDGRVNAWASGQPACVFIRISSQHGSNITLRFLSSQAIANDFFPPVAEATSHLPCEIWERGMNRT